MNNKMDTSITGASLIVVIFALLSRGLGFFREIIFASTFGLGKEFDLYLIGAVLPLTVHTIFLYIGQNFYIPVYHNITRKIPAEKNRILTPVIIIFFIIGLITTAILYAGSGNFIDAYISGQSSSDIILTKNIFRIILISVPFSAVNSILIAHLQANFKFSIPAISTLFLNLTVIIFVLLLSGYYGIYSIAIGFVTGVFFQLLFLLFKSRIKLFFNKFKKYWELVWDTEITKGIFLIIVIETVGQFYQLADRYFLSFVDSGGISALSYAQNFYLMFVSLFSITLTTVLFPRLTKSLSENKSEELQDSVLKGLKTNILVFTLIFSLMYFYSEELINLIYQRGNFSYKDTLTTATVLKYYSVSIVFYSSYSLLNKLIYAKKMYLALLGITITGILLKVLMNFIFVGQLKQNGLALSTSLAYIFFFLGSLFVTLKNIIDLDLRFFINEFFFYIINAVVSFIITGLIFSLLSFPEVILNILGPLIYLGVFCSNLSLIRNKTYVFLEKNILALIRYNMNRKEHG
ncbi:MAG: murein biosynthesis integral membrane protein MurJ [Ignavibacteriaceae bacterium]